METHGFDGQSPTRSAARPHFAIRHRQHAGADPESEAYLAGDLTQRNGFSQSLSPENVERNIAVPKTKPSRPAQGRRRLEETPRFAASAPPRPPLGDSGEGVDHRVEIGAHSQTEGIEVI